MPGTSGREFAVVGGASMLGSHIGPRLRSDFARKDVLLDSLAPRSTATVNFMPSNTRCTFVRGDVLNPNRRIGSMANTVGVFAGAGLLAGPMRATP
jgi:UDP-glucose 4-epimerase